MAWMRDFSGTSSHQHTSNAPLSISKLLTLVFALAPSCTGLVADSRPRHTGEILQRGSHFDDQFINANLVVRSAQPTATSSKTAVFSLSGTATPVSSNAASTSTSISTSTSTSTSSSSSSSTSSTAAAFTGIPQPFDTPLGTNFTSTTCPTLFRRVISDSAVRNCVPLSLLIQGSHSFFQVESSEPALTKTLDISCNVISAICNDLLQSYAAAVASSSGCQADLAQQNQRVQFLFNGLISYLPIYNAACLQVSATNVSSTTNSSTYCFTAAVENWENPADLALFTLPLGLALSNTTVPTCSSCTQKTMSIFANAARNLTSPLSTNYIAAASLVNSGCGANFVNATFDPIPGSDKISGSVSLTVGRLTTLALAFTTGAFLLL